MTGHAFVAMSGGVDSTACAILLRGQGYRVAGITMELGDGGGAAQKAADACRELGIEHHVISMEDSFARLVKQPFCAEYIAGRTPNPCVLCNREIKFGALMDEALRLGADYFATGHYARVERQENGRFALKKALNAAKDQSYVLYTLGQQRLSRVLFPLGALSKDDARSALRVHGLALADSPESQDICFIPDGDYAAFIGQYMGLEPEAGNFVGAGGKILGLHRGIINYTVGQRRGTGVAAGQPLYVIAKDAERREVVLGTQQELMRSAFEVGDLRWIDCAPGASFRASVRTRYHQIERQCEVVLHENGAQVELAQSARAPAPGQSAVFYDGDTVLGGGIIL